MIQTIGLNDPFNIAKHWAFCRMIDSCPCVDRISKVDVLFALFCCSSAQQMMYIMKKFQKLKNFLG